MISAMIWIRIVIQYIFDDLDAVFPPYVSAFYGACFMFVIKEIDKLAKEK